MGVYKKNNRWLIDYYLPDGKRKREVVTIKGIDPSNINRQDALKALNIRKAQIAEGKFEIAQTKKPVLFEKFTDRYYETINPPFSSISIYNFLLTKHLIILYNLKAFVSLC